MCMYLLSKRKLSCLLVIEYKGNFLKPDMRKKTFVGIGNNYSKIVFNFIGNTIFAYCVIIALALMLFSYTTIECEVSGASMQPTLNYPNEDKHDVVYINKFDTDYKYGDIIVIDTAEDSIIKRVVGLPGDLIDVVKVNGIYKLERNGEVIEEDYILINNSPLVPTSSQNGMDIAYHRRWLDLKENNPDLFNVDGKLVVGETCVFALGDHRKVSVDSFYYGPFEMSQIKGIVENVKYHNTSSFEFYWSYVMEGKFFVTLFNLF